MVAPVLEVPRSVPSRRPTFRAARVTVMLLALVFMVAPAAGHAAVTVFEKDDFSLALGLRMQPRMSLENLAAGIENDWRRDFLIRRTRLVAQGKFHDAFYKLEWKVDNTDLNAAVPGAAVENAYIQFPLRGPVELRAGLYDLPFSRDLLTSDSKHLAVDRGSASAVPSALGLADNAVGFSLVGKVRGGRAEYAVGLFDNRNFPTRLQDVPMVAGRLDLNLGATNDVFMDAHFGDASWCSIGLDGSYAVLDTLGSTDNGSTAAFGADGMIDVPVGGGRVLGRAEANHIITQALGGGAEIGTTVWMVGLGVLVLHQHLQPMVRFDQVRFDDAVGGGTDDITYVGLNYYINGHGLKVQSDVRFEGGTGEAVDGVRVQAQIDY